MKKRYCISAKKRVLAFATALLVCLTGCAGSEQQEPVDEQLPEQIVQIVDSLCKYDVEVFDVLLAGAEGGNLDTADALRLCGPLITALRFGSEADWTEEIYAPMHTMMEYFYEHGVLPRAPYGAGGIEEYTTSMDAPYLAVAVQLAYERSGDERFLQYRDDLIAYMVKGTEENGFVLKLSETRWWPLEYAWPTVTEEDAWFVVNGSWFGMVCVEMLENLTGDPRLTELSGKALNAYKAYADDFFYPDGTWCYYALNGLDGKPVINRIEKLLVEIRALSALYQLTSQTFYLEQCQIRQGLLGDALPVYISSDGQTSTAFLLRACIPHPYYVETYPNTIEFLDDTGAVLLTAEAPDRLVENSYMQLEVPEGVASYRLYAQINPVAKTLLVEAPVVYLEQEGLKPVALSGRWEANYDGTMVGNQLAIRPDASEKLQAWLWFTPDEPVSYNEMTFFVLEMNNSTDQTLPMVANFYEEDGEVFGRTVMPCTPGKSLQVLNHLGFKDLSWPLTDLEQLSFGLVTNSMTQPEAEIEIGNFYICHNTAQVVNFLSQYEFSDYWQIKAD